MATIYQDYQEQLSLRSFCQLTGYPRHLLRYHLKTEAKRQERQQQTEQELEALQELALKHKTYGYRRIYIELKKILQVGREKVRKYMKLLNLQQNLPRKKRRKAPEPTRVCDLPEGRKVQIDATRFQLDTGVAWKYVVEDVSSRACLALYTVKQLSQESASAALVKAQTKLHSLGIKDKLVIQSDGGSDFTSQFFQDTCSSINALWKRCRVSEKAGMAILERLNRTLKYDFVFWHEPQTLNELKDLDRQFDDWYNHQRIHSSINYLTPWQKLLQDARLS